MADAPTFVSIQNCLRRERLVELLERCGSLHVALVGDLGLDINWYIDMTAASLSRETPHFVKPIVREEFSLGAGAYVVRNLAALGVGMIHVFSVLGNDWRGDLIRRGFDQLGVDTTKLLTVPDQFTTAFIRPILMGYEAQQEDARLDFKNRMPLREEEVNALLDRLTISLPQLDAVLVADYLGVDGVVNDHTLKRLNELAEQNTHIKFIADSRYRIHLFRSMILKPNRLEAINVVKANANNEFSINDTSLLTSIAQQLSTTTMRPAFVTLGEKGALVCNDKSVIHINAAEQPEPTDSTGAGDVFNATLGVMLAAGSTPTEACAIANLAASVVVKEAGTTGATSPQGIIARFDSLP